MIKFEITGLKEVQKKLHELGQFARDINGPLVDLKFDPSDPAGVNKAVGEMRRAVDRKAIAYRGNASVIALAEQTKNNLEAQIRTMKAS